MKNKFAFTVLGIFLITNVGLAQPAKAIIEQHITFTGGREAWKKITTIVMTGEYDYGGISFPFISYSKTPDRYKFVVEQNGSYYAQTFDGKNGWRIDAFKNEVRPTPLAGKEAKAMANEADVALESPFIDYQKKGHQALADGQDSVQGVPCNRVNFIRKSGETETYYFKTGTGELVKKSAPSKNAELQGALLNTLYSDYRVVNGVKFPFKAVSETGGQTILTIIVQEVKVNVAVRDSEFTSTKPSSQN